MAFTPFLSTLERNEKLYADEYERMVFHRANSYTVLLSPLLMMVGCAAAAWVLPAPYWMVSIFPFFGFLIATAISGMWLRSHIPAPAMTASTVLQNKSYVIAYIAITLLWLAGPFVRQLIVGSTDDAVAQMGGAIGGVVGMIIGLGAALLMVPVISRYQRQKDLRRLNEQADREEN